MKKNLHLGSTLAKICKFTMQFIPKKKNLVLFSAWFGKKYADNTRYEFEYCLKNSTLDVYWYTKDKKLYHELQKNCIPVIYAKSIKGIWYQIRAAMLVTTVKFEDFNQFLLRDCIFLDIGHGFPGKPDSLELSQKTESASWYYQCKSKVLLYKVAASSFACKCITSGSDIEPQFCVFCNFPRIDVLFDKNLQKNKNIVIENYRKDNKIISYLPTHRSSGKRPMPMDMILNLEEIQSICEKSHSIFVIKKHFYHNAEYENLSQYPNIIDVTNEDIDTQVLLAQSDVLITDFSSCYVDFLATDRPIIFYAYDYDDYLANERDYYWKYDKINAGYTTKTKEDFCEALKKVVSDWDDLQHANGRKAMREVYFDPEVEMGTTREKLMGVIIQLLDGKYTSYDWNSKMKQTLH